MNNSLSAKVTVPNEPSRRQLLATKMRFSNGAISWLVTLTPDDKRSDNDEADGFCFDVEDGTNVEATIEAKLESEPFHATAVDWDYAGPLLTQREKPEFWSQRKPKRATRLQAPYATRAGSVP
jgi:hypothetical protein